MFNVSRINSLVCTTVAVKAGIPDFLRSHFQSKMCNRFAWNVFHIHAPVTYIAQTSQCDASHQSWIGSTFCPFSTRQMTVKWSPAVSYFHALVTVYCHPPIRLRKLACNRLHSRTNTQDSVSPRFDAWTLICQETQIYTGLGNQMLCSLGRTFNSISQVLSFFSLISNTLWLF